MGTEPGGTERLVVVTGGPGAGKTTLLDRLRALGYATTPDAARELIREDPRVRDDPAAFQDLILAREVEAYAAALAGSGTVFFDRGIPGVVAGFRVDGLPVPPHVDAAARAHRYHRTVFVAPPWRDVYVTDTERTHTYDHAVAVHAAIVPAYREYGYDLVDLPLAPVDERVAFVLDRCGLA